MRTLRLNLIICGCKLSVTITNAEILAIYPVFIVQALNKTIPLKYLNQIYINQP